MPPADDRYEPSAAEALGDHVEAFLARHSVEELAEALACSAPLAGLVDALLALADAAAEPADDDARDYLSN